MLRQPGLAVSLALLAALAPAAWPRAAGAAEATCAADERWDTAMGMCMPGSAPSGNETSVTGHGAVFAVYTAAGGPRGAHQFAAPNWFMLEARRALGARQMLSIEAMATAELWTFPDHGYAELLQAGEERSDGSVYRDAQHPHSSPLMGLRLADEIALGEGRSLVLSFAPRGASTDGPVAFMHRASARDNPDAPLGHHVGQDVGHISSTVLAAGLALGGFTVEASAFNGDEPQPSKVDLPLGPMNSTALRLSQELAPGHRVSAWLAQVRQADELYPGTRSATRSGLAILDHWVVGPGAIDHSLVYGSIARHPDGNRLQSILDEGTWALRGRELWWRAELLQRLPVELGIPVGGATDEWQSRWVSALTVGCTQWWRTGATVQAGLGLALTADAVPAAWATAYGGRTPLTWRLVLQARLALPPRN